MNLSLRIAVFCCVAALVCGQDGGKSTVLNSPIKDKRKHPGLKGIKNAPKVDPDVDAKGRATFIEIRDAAHLESYVDELPARGFFAVLFIEKKTNEFHDEKEIDQLKGEWRRLAETQKPWAQKADVDFDKWIFGWSDNRKLADEYGCSRTVNLKTHSLQREWHYNCMMTFKSNSKGTSIHQEGKADWARGDFEAYVFTTAKGDLPHYKKENIAHMDL